MESPEKKVRGEAADVEPERADLHGTVGSIPVNQDSPGPSSLKRIFEVLQNKGTLVLFPEGSRTFDGSFGKGEPGIAMIAARSGTPVVPIRLFGAL